MSLETITDDQFAAEVLELRPAVLVDFGGLVPAVP